MIISTERLDLHPLPLPLIDAVLSGDLATAQRLAPFDVADDTFADDTRVLTYRQAQLRQHPSELPWLYRAAVLKGTRQVVGRGGFHAPPTDGTVEIGYRITDAHRGQRLATELAAGLIGWASAQGARRCLGSTAPGNVASQRVLARLGFRRTGEQIDEEDGLEYVYTLDLGQPGAIR